MKTFDAIFGDSLPGYQLMVDMLDRRTVKELLRFHGLAAHTPGRQLAQYLADPDALASAFRDLPERCALHLERVVFDPVHPRPVWHREQVGAQMQAELAQRGLAFVLWNQEHIPWREEPRAAARWYLTRHPELVDTGPPPPAPDLDPVPGRALLRDVCLFLALVARSRPKLNKNGTVPRAFSRGFEQSSWHAPALEAAGEHFPLSGIVYSLVSHEDLIDTEERHMVLTHRAQAFLDDARPLELDPPETVFAGTSPILVTRFILALTQALPEAAWLRIDRLLEQMRSVDASAQRSGVLTSVFTLAALGRLVRSGGSMWSPRQVRFVGGAPRLPAPKEAPVLQPTLEVLVPLDAAEVDFTTLHLVADLVRRDRVSVYRLSRASIQRAIMSGMPWEGVIRRIEAVNRGPLPTAVQRQLDGWSQGFGQYRFRSGTLIECETPAQRDELVHWSKVSKAVVQPLGDRWAWVRDDKVEAVRKALVDRGTPPDAGIDRPGARERRSTLDIDWP